MHIRPWYFRALIGGLLSAAAMAAFAANPAPPTATAEATSEQTAAFKQHVAAFRKTLAKRDLPEAKKQIGELEKLAIAPDQQEAVERLDLLYQYYEGFWQAIGNAAATMKPTDEIAVNASTRWIVVEAQPTYITLRGEGQSRRFTIENMPANVALTIAARWFDKNPKNKLFIGAFYASEGSLADAKKMWDEAAKAGVDAKPLLPLLSKELKDQ